MPKKHKIEGLTLDLTRIPSSGTFILEDLIVHEVVPSPKSDHCDICNSNVVGAFREYDGKHMCGLCCAIYREKITGAAIEKLKQEYARPCIFCGNTDERKNFDHINMFTKEGCVGFMVEQGLNSDDILAEIDKCQILCIKCHRKVSSYERKQGFFQKKRSLNAQKRAGKDISQLLSVFMTEYSEIMGPFYAALAGEGASKLNKISVGGI